MLKIFISAHYLLTCHVERYWQICWVFSSYVTWLLCISTHFLFHLHYFLILWTILLSRVELMLISWACWYVLRWLTMPLRRRIRIFLIFLSWRLRYLSLISCHLWFLSMLPGILRLLTLSLITRINGMMLKRTIIFRYMRRFLDNRYIFMKLITTIMHNKLFILIW